MRWYLIDADDARKVAKLHEVPYPLKKGERFDIGQGALLFKDTYGRYVIACQAHDGSDLPDFLKIDGIEKGGKLHISVSKTKIKKRK